ncbi:MAG: galactose-1-phosphate uridylyltransferase [Chloroflexi bacterium]|jgi:UDPglucose--hexose-1-phosphate uridylyltransferase|nr:galactose-1-phosphate uridylyltransferase [Chloroflexota bacterium]
MSEIRQDPTTKEWVIMARERAKRPHDFVRQQAEAEPPAFEPSCPFCPGNEAMTPPEILSYRDHETQSWRVRAFANKFPALAPEGSTMRREEEGFFLGMDGVGVHEVIVETPVHNKPLALMEDSGVADVLFAYQERYNALSRVPFIKLIIIFKNHGPSAGTSLEHPHSQLVATPVVPRHIRMQYEVAIRYYDNTGRCLHSDLVGHELRIGKRVVMETERFVVFHPFASHQPFETWIVPKAHQACFGNASAEDLEDLAHVLRITLLKLYRGLNNPDFNYVIDTAPAGDENKDYYLWHLRIIPRLTEMAGFEIGSGIYINTALPEETAKFVRELKVE